MKKIMLAGVISITLNACSSQPEDIEAHYVSPLQYHQHSCEQLQLEVQRIGRRLVEITGHQAEEATGDAVALGVGVFLFWPALFFMIGDDKEHELARLKGEAEAIESAAIRNDCTALIQQIENARAAAKRSADKASNGGDRSKERCGSSPACNIEGAS